MRRVEILLHYHNVTGILELSHLMTKLYIILPQYEGVTKLYIMLSVFSLDYTSLIRTKHSIILDWSLEISSWAVELVADFAQILLRFLSDFAQILLRFLLRFCSDFPQIFWRWTSLCSDFAQILLRFLLRFSSDFLKVDIALLRFCSDFPQIFMELAQILLRFSSDFKIWDTHFAQILLRFCSDFQLWFKSYVDNPDPAVHGDFTTFCASTARVL